ncbi:ABC transporter permease [Saccharothrix australiensis]|uniref:ABC-2 family transporter n=1 Tax=Saccharothrix australiensis TaxID=2072 RepID=A0A495W9Y0_9PSEU|nr:ABC transporter permease subunit [Saccharothrix australiensis]RKT57513.1 ABC-2 family transporter [Saccharothrix australiensis]
MTATTTAPVSTPPRRRTGVGWGDLAWLTWRQHRWQLGGLGAAVAVVALSCLIIAWTINATGTALHGFLGLGGFGGAIQLASLLPVAFGGVIAVFWAAPLLAREYEQKTYVVVWSQDLTPTRWLVGKVVLLGVPAVGLAAALGSAVLTAQHAMNSVTGGHPAYRAFEDEHFEAMPLLQIGYAAFGFALGLAFSAVTRRTVLSMAVTLGAFVATRFAVAKFWRPHYQAPERVLWPFGTRDQGSSDRIDDGVMYVKSGYTDAAGNPVEYPLECNVRSAGPDNGFDTCMREHGVVNTYLDYQPVDRVVPFQLIETALFVIAAAALLVLAFRLGLPRSPRRTTPTT